MLDIQVPTNYAGRTVAVFIQFTGVALLSLPIGVIGTYMCFTYTILRSVYNTMHVLYYTVNHTILF